MPKIDVYNMEGKKVSDVELNDNVFGIEPNEAIVHKKEQVEQDKVL